MDRRRLSRMGGWFGWRTEKSEGCIYGTHMQGFVHGLSRCKRSRGQHKKYLPAHSYVA
jgi:hypothetical protein